MYTLCAFYECDYWLRIITVLPEGFLSYWQQLCREHLFSVPHEMVVGGETRFHSVKNGLNLVADDAIVAIHDGAHPFVSPELIARAPITRRGKNIPPGAPEAKQDIEKRNLTVCSFFFQYSCSRKVCHKHHNNYSCRTTDRKSVV